jgi:uncharacterized protein with HEPN domain
MPPDLHDAAYLHDMLVSARIAVEFAKSRSRTELVTDLMFGDAVIRRLEIVGEAARNVSQTFRDSHPEIPWRAIMATRHILAHEYDGVDYDTVWRIVKEHLPLLIKQLEELLKEIPPPEG